MINPRQNRSEVDLSASIPWVNDSGEEIPAYAVVQLRTNFDTTSHASKPNSSEGLFFASGFAPVAMGKTGESLVWNRPRPVLLDTGIEVGDQVGPVDGEWMMTASGTGFRVLRQPNVEGVGVVVQVGGGGGGDPIIQFRPVDVCEGVGFVCDCVTAEVVTASCSSSISPGDIVQVWDQSRGWFQMDPELLFNSVGWAHRVKTTEEDPYGLSFDIGPCRWVVFSMDCVEQDEV